MSKCRGFFIPKYTKKTITINNGTNPNPDSINRVAIDGELHTYESYTEVESVCMDCKKKECNDAPRQEEAKPRRS